METTTVIDEFGQFDVALEPALLFNNDQFFVLVILIARLLPKATSAEMNAFNFASETDASCSPINY